jgi:hypothetical protein
MRGVGWVANADESGAGGDQAIAKGSDDGIVRREPAGQGGGE